MIGRLHEALEWECLEPQVGIAILPGWLSLLPSLHSEKDKGCFLGALRGSNNCRLGVAYRFRGARQK
jgi:hypothetical protein